MIRLIPHLILGVRMLLAINLALLVSGCVAPKTHRATDDLVRLIANSYSQQETGAKGEHLDPVKMRDLPTQRGWEYLSSEIDGKSEESRKLARQALAGNASEFISALNAKLADAQRLRDTDHDFYVRFEAALRENERRFYYAEEEGAQSKMMLFGNLKNKWALKNFIHAATRTNGVARINVFEVYGMAQDVFGSMVSSNLLSAELAGDSDSLNLWSLLKGYLLAYEQGDFVMRDGTVLGKPTVGTTNIGGGITVAIPDAAAAGIATVLLEAMCDYGNGTPVFYEETNQTTYKQVYVPIDQVYPAASNTFTDIIGGGAKSIASSNAFVLVYMPSNITGTNYFIGGKAPTAAAFLPRIPVVPSYAAKKKLQGGITAQEAQFILAVSSLTDQEAKALAGLLIRSFGGLTGGGGRFGFGSFHVSLGDNQMLSEIVEDLFSSYSYHVAEHDLTKAFWKYYDKNNGDDPVQYILKNYSELIAKIKAIQSNVN